MEPPEYADVRRDFLAALGEAIVAWNQAENVLRNLLLTLCGGSPASYVLTADLSSQGIIDGLKAISPTQTIEVCEAVSAVCKYYERIRAYRNYYVHGIIALGWNTTTKIGSGLINTSSSKGKLAFHMEQIETDKLAQLREWANTLMKAAGAIIDVANPQAGSFADPTLPTAQTLVPPVTLQKKAHFPLNDPQSPQIGAA